MPSSVIHAFWYRARRKELRVLFKTQKTYIYSDVPEKMYADMKAAASKGEFFNQNIRGRFAYRRHADAW